ncbi:MAG: serine--tRNA ligase [Candidatus Levybacteria bacterium]|nr:serine--tRNA ligase [Candidatus Levybacteria bacterium]
MIDIKYLRENSDEVEKAALAKKVQVSVSSILEIDSKKRELDSEVQVLREKRNAHSSTIKGKPTPEQIETGKKIKEELEGKESALSALDQELKELLLKIPNPSKADVKVGKNDTENDVVKKVGEPTKFDFAPKDHLDIGEALDIIDVQRAAKVSGARFAYLKNEGALLEFALVQFAMETLMKDGFRPIVPPVLIKTDVMRGLGYMENGGDEDMFHLEKDGFTLVGTAEHSIVPMHSDEVFSESDLPRRYVGFSTAFRREAGSYGKDTKGILRVHQFDKIEMVSYVKEGEDDKEQDLLLSIEEKLFQALEIPYQVIKMCTGDLGFPAARKFDIEAWMPGQDKYREVTSVSTITDFQSRRLNIKYQENGEKKFAYILNGTAFAVGRTLIAILENHQQADGSVLIPQVLQKYMGGITKIEKK